MVFGLPDLFKFSHTLRYIHDERGQRMDEALNIADLVCNCAIYSVNLKL